MLFLDKQMMNNQKSEDNVHLFISVSQIVSTNDTKRKLLT